MNKCKKIFYLRMNLLESNKKVLSIKYRVPSRLPIMLVIVLSTQYFVLSTSSCKKDTKYIYDVKDVSVKQPGSNKTRVKTTTEFISIAYSDLFNTTIPQDALTLIQQTYDAFGDKKL